MSLWQRIKARPLSMHSVLWALLAIVLAPAVFAQFYAVTSWRHERIRLELEESKQVALSLAGGFDQYVQDVSRQELALGKMILGPRKLAAGEIGELLTSSADSYKDVRSFYLTDERGTIRASSDNLGLGTNLFDREYYQELVQGRTWSVSNLLTSRITGRPIIIIAHAVRDAENHLVGAVIAATDPTQLFTSIYHQDLPPQTAVSLYDRTGTLVFLYPSSALAAENPHSAPHGLLAEAMHSGVASGRYYSDLLDQWRLGSAVRSVKTQWYAQVSRSYAYALEPVNNAITISIFLFGALALLAVGLSLGVHRVVLRSLASLQEQSRRLGRNVLAQQEHPRRIRELAELGEGLNATALNLQLAQQQRQRYLGRLYGLLDASGQLLAELDREELLGRILDQARDLLHCEFACVGTAYVNGSFGQVQSRLPQHLADLTLQPLLDEFIGQADFVRVSAADLRQRRPEWDLRGLLSARLRDRAGTVCGVLLAGGRREHDFVPEDEALLKQYAVIANLALQQAELRAELRREAAGSREGRLILDALLENVPEGIAIADAARENILYLSRYGADTSSGQGLAVGLPLSELPARWPLKDESGQELPWHDYPLARTLREGGVIRRRQLRSLAEDGDARILECSAAALRDPNGRVAGSLMVWHDITDQKEFEERLRSVAQFPDENPYPILRISGQGKLLYANRASDSLLAEWNSRVGDPCPKALAELLGRVLAEGKTSEYDVPCADRVYSFVLTPIPGSEYVNLYGRDVTERRRAQEQLRLSYARVSEVLASMTDAYFAVDRQWRFLEINPVAEQLYQRSSAGLVGQVIWEAFPILRGGDFHRQATQAMQTDRSVHFDLQSVLIDRWFEVHAYPRPDRLEVYLRDITERKRSEQAIERAAAELARSNEDLEQFAYVASHDLQEPLRMVSGYLQLLLRRYEGKLDADADQFIRYAVEGSARMQALILDLLTFSRVQTRAHDFQDVDMEAVVRQALLNLAAAIAEAQGEITYDPMPTIQGDSSQLVQLVQNLISNAIKFRRPGHPVRVHLGVRPEEGGWLFWVKDNGIGIDPAYQDRIFKIFQRLHARDEYPGTGIGLAICKKIVARHGGRIWVESQADQGATFYFTVR